MCEIRQPLAFTSIDMAAVVEDSDIFGYFANRLIVALVVFHDYFAIIFQQQVTEIDALSGATALDYLQSQLGLMSMVSEVKLDPIYGQFAGAGWEWINFAYLIGGIALILTGIIKWHIPVAVILSLFLLSLIFNLSDPDIYASPLFHLFGGGSILCAFFIATDPVSASTTPMGRLFYGALIGILIYVIRVWGAYPDGVAFAVLIANALVPVIDKYTKPKIVGETSS